MTNVILKITEAQGFVLQRHSEGLSRDGDLPRCRIRRKQHGSDKRTRLEKAQAFRTRFRSFR